MESPGKRISAGNWKDYVGLWAGPQRIVLNAIMLIDVRRQPLKIGGTVVWVCVLDVWTRGTWVKQKLCAFSCLWMPLSSWCSDCLDFPTVLDNKQEWWTKTNVICFLTSFHLHILLQQQSTKVEKSPILSLLPVTILNDLPYTISYLFIIYKISA